MIHVIISGSCAPNAHKSVNLTMNIVFSMAILFQFEDGEIYFLDLSIVYDDLVE